MLNNNKVTNYIIYALGEILLVIVGILIALNINNRNEAAKDRTRVDNILVKIAENLEREIVDGRNIHEYFLRKDSLIGIVLHKDLTRSDIVSENGSYSDVATVLDDLNSLFTNRNYYDVLNQNINSVPPEYDGLMSMLDGLYTQMRERLLKTEALYIEEYKKSGAYRESTYAWDSNDDFEEASLEYFLQDFHFKNFAKKYRKTGIDYYSVRALDFRILAILVYVKIHETLEKEIGEKAFLLDVNLIKTFEGEYSLDHPEYDRLKVVQHNRAPIPILDVFLSKKGAGYAGVRGEILQPLSKYEYASYSAFRHIQFLPDSTGKPLQIRLKQAEKEYVAVKIKD